MIEKTPNKEGQTYSQTLINELNEQQLAKKMKNLAFSVLILDTLLILALFMSFKEFLYSLFILVEMSTVGLIALVSIRTQKVNKYTYRAQRMTVLATAILSKCIFEIVTNTRAPSILGIIFQMLVPGIIVMLLKLWFIFIKRQVQKKLAERQMNIQDHSQFYTYNQIGETNSKL